MNEKSGTGGKERISENIPFWIGSSGSGTGYTGQQIFWLTKKNVCFLCIFGCWIRICSQNFFSPTSLALH